MPKVFISYSHDSEEHCQLVRELSDRLNMNDIDCDIDQYVNGTPEQGWPIWMESKLSEAEFVLVTCTETYLKRVQGKESPGTGKGVKWESLLTYQDIYENDSLNQKFIPIFFSPTDAKFVPMPLKAVSHYDLNKDDGYEMLYRYLTKQPLVIKPSQGKKLHLPPNNTLPGYNTTILSDHLPSTTSASYSQPDNSVAHPEKQDRAVNDDFVDRCLNKRLEDALQTFSSQPKVWVSPILCKKSEIAKDAKSEPRVNFLDFVSNPKSTIIKSPPQYGQTCLAHYLVREAWRTQGKHLWLYLDSKDLKPYAASLNEAISNELSILGLSELDIRCVILDSWSANEKDALKLLKNLCSRFENIPIICMEQVDTGQFNSIDNYGLSRKFDVLYLWALAREDIRKLVAAYNEIKHIGDEDLVIGRIASDLDVLNLHRTPLNCLTLLKVSEIDFDESPVNRSEMIKRVLFLLFNVDDIPTYKSRPDLKDCEYVLGYFCELLIREGAYSFTRDKFLREIQRFCHERLIDLETQVVFDVLYSNNILVKRGSVFCFKFSYWIFYFAAQRMHHDQNFASFIFEDMRYAQRPDLIEFYTGIDRRRDDALQILIKDIKACSENVKNKCGLPEGLNPYEFATWKTSPETVAQMQKIIAEGVLESSLPAEIKDQFADRVYDKTRPYDQSISNFLSDYSFNTMMKTMKAGARALRNSDYVSSDIKRQLLLEIINCWEQATKVLLIILPILAKHGNAQYDGAGFVLTDDFGDTPEERFGRILCDIPYNVISWCQDDLFSRKMGPLLIDQLTNDASGAIGRHELILLLIYKRPRDWSNHVHRYIVANKKNSYYLFDVYKTLMQQYKYGFVSPQALKDMQFLIKSAVTKHLTGEKNPSLKSINKMMKDHENVIPPREV
ncbi:MAG TPA: SEFIR domain-containing protein [Sulfuriferula sp.]|nr:SEFIR domain-containing protein [Sulfuriferula sp.]